MNTVVSISTGVQSDEFDNSAVKPKATSKKLSRSSPRMVFLGKGVPKICSKFTGEHPCQNLISAKLFCNFIEIALQHECSPVNLCHFFGTPSPKNTSAGLPLIVDVKS